MFEVTGIRSWNLNADDLEASVTFYQAVLGAEGSMRHSVAGADVARLKVGGFGIGLFDGSQGPRPGVPHHTFDFKGGPRDPQELEQELEAKGVKVDGVRPHGEGPGYSVYVVDPSGNRLELSTDPA